MNWFAVAVFIEAPNPNAPGSFEYVKATGKMGRDIHAVLCRADGVL
jgi:hypothetical protein